MNVPVKPEEAAFTVFDNGINVTGIKVSFEQTGSETAESYWILTYWNGKTSKFLQSTARRILSLDERNVPTHHSIASLRSELISQIKVWRKYEEDNQLELKEYKRLREKYG